MIPIVATKGLNINQSGLNIDMICIDGNIGELEMSFIHLYKFIFDKAKKKYVGLQKLKTKLICNIFVKKCRNQRSSLSFDNCK